MKPEVIFLGTSEATPTAKRSQAAIFLKYLGENMLFDCGEGTQRQMKIAKVSPTSLSRIFITHWHSDHVLGLPGLMQTLALNDYPHALKIYGPRGTKKIIKLLLSIFIFKNKLKTEIHEITKNGKFLDSRNFYVEAYKMKHFTPCLAYKFVEKDKRKIKKNFIKKIPGVLLGKLQKGKTIKYKGKTITSKQATFYKPGKKIGIILDTLYHPGCIKTAKNADVLICEATFLDSEHRDKARERGHLTAKQAGMIAKKAKVKELYLMHLSQRYANKKKEQQILNEAQRQFKKTKIAQDFMRINL
jgi:ribonuclease Z